MKCWKKNGGRGSRSKPIFRLPFFFLPVAILLTQFLVAQALLAQDEPTFRAESNVVLVPALVRDASGHAVYGLQAKDFILEDNGVAQVVHLDDETQPEPLSIIVAIQTGRSARHEFPRIRGLNSMLGPILQEPQTQVAIVEFDSQIQLEQDFTSDPDQIAQALAKIESGDSGAAILDTVRYSVNLLDKLPEDRKRVLLLISETRDHGSHWATIDDLVTLIGNSNTTVYSLSFSPALSNILDTARGKNQDEANAMPDLIALLAAAKEAMRSNTPKAIASQTGGEYQLFESQQRFESRMLDFTNHLHSRYLLSFEPKNPQPGMHRIQVRLAKAGDATVLTRSSYWASE
jgi:VWFA-related protein